MKPNRLLVVLLLSSAVTAFAAPVPYLMRDHSTSTLMDQATAEQLWMAQNSPKLAKLYPAKKWGFVSEVEGGFDDAKVCIVTARAMMLPRSGANLVFKPAKTATTYGSQAGASPQQCKELGKSKLKEAIVAVNSALLER
jgi:hypothetical protein